MSNQFYNPILPLDEYVPDGEPHVFGDRVYLYGSHDRENGTRFCELDYTVYSAPINDLSSWTCHGVSYKKEQDPRSRDGKLVDYYAPDCVRGNDGKYYLYYVAMGPNTQNFGPMSVAVSDKPEGPFEYLGDIRYKDGTPVLKYLTNDPAVINDNGRIWLYYGWGLGRDFRNKLLAPLYNFVQSKLFKRSIKEIKQTKPSILSCAVVELENDMLTVKNEPKAVLDSKTSADKKSELYNHAFYEAPSIRKFNDTYYLIYSSGQNNELCYATSKYPDKDFVYRGVIVSNSDLGYKGNTQRLAPAGTIHGSIENINGEYYVFYHRCTNNTDYSRQACAEKITMLDDGSIPQVEITTQGLGNPLKANGKFPAIICCNLYNAKTGNVQGNGHATSQPNVACVDNERFVRAISNGTTIGYKYLCFDNATRLSVRVRGSSGSLFVGTGAKPLAEIKINLSREWKTYAVDFNTPNGVYPLYFTFKGKGQIDFIEFEVE
ncbi:MAG: family 43 glycosylhydrolase [Clostridia bacterium]|nr:family 43 glycosylhydrolase [Clostridia bacterium]